MDELLDGLSEYDAAVRSFLECQIAECLLNIDLTKKTVVLMSNGNTGKTKLLDLLRDMSGPLGRILPGNREFFLGARKNNVNDVKIMRHKTRLLCEELGSKKSPINADVYKLISGGFSMSAESNKFNDAIKVIPKVIITCNSPQFTQFGDAEKRRTIFFNSRYAFVQNPDPDSP